MANNTLNTEPKTIQQIMELSLDKRRQFYSAVRYDNEQRVDIGKVIIDGVPFDNYGTYSFIWEKSYVKSPERSSDGSIGNLDSYSTFLTGHLKIDFSLMSIDYYRNLMKLIYNSNEHIVECYDIVYNQWIKLKMYFTTEEMPKLWTIAHKLQKSKDEWDEWIDLVGVQDYTVEMVGTNNDLDLVGVRYYSNYPENSNLSGTESSQFQGGEDVVIGDEFILGQGISFTAPVGYKFNGWRQGADDKQVFSDGIVWKVGSRGEIDTNTNSINFYAVWQATSKNNLGFNYGISAPLFSSEVADLETYYSREVQQGQSIGVLPQFVMPSVKYKGVNDTSAVDKFPYENGYWYKSPVKGEKVTNNELYWRGADTTIYLLFDIKTFNVSYVTNQSDFTIPPQSIAYGSPITLPQLAKQGWTFRGWYLDSSFTKTLQGNTMPPEDITLYAKWEQQ